MKLKKYAELIKELADKHPNLEVVCSSDDEGNSFNPIYFAPSVIEINGQNVACIN